MRSLNNNSFQTNQKHPYFASTNTENRLPSLVSQYMDMFDTSKVNASLLQKREHPSVDDFLQSELQKKVKTLMGARDCKPVNTVPNLAAMLFNQNLPLTAAPFQNISLRNLQQQTNLIRQQQQQQEALHLLQSQLQKNPLSFNHFQPTLITNNKKAFTMEEVPVKEEHTEPLMKGTSVISTIQGKVSDIMSENNTTNDGLSECSGDKDDFLMPSPIRDEPVLAEFTKAFPEWDLATIFSFMKSGKSMEVFEKERKFKIERKLKKQKKNSDAKQNKTKKTNAI